METQQKYSTPRSKRFGGNLHRIIFWVIVGVVLAAVFALIFGIVVKYLWSVTLSPIFGFTEITYWQAVGIVILARLIFGGFGHRSRHNNDHRTAHNKRYDKRPSIFNKLHDRFHGWEESGDESNQIVNLPEDIQQHYNKFWEKEGKQAFDEYLSKLEEKKES